MKKTKKDKKRKLYLVTGGSGLIGSYFLKSSQKLVESNVILSPSHSELDISDINSVRRFVKFHEPDIVIHFAAFRDATAAEGERGNKKGPVWKTNVWGSQNVAAICQEYKSYLIHISSDYVFSGSEQRKGPYSEVDPFEENDELLSWYGITKREAEKKVKKTHKDAAIIRIGNVTQPGEISNLDYIGKILWLHQQKKLYPLFMDQTLTLTYIPSIAEVIDKLIKNRLVGIYHVASIDLCTPYQMGNHLIKQAKLKDKDLIKYKRHKVKGISIDTFLETYPRRYPKFGGLRAENTQKKLGIKFHTWKEIVEKFLLHA